MRRPHFPSPSPLIPTTSNNTTDHKLSTSKLMTSSVGPSPTFHFHQQLKQQQQRTTSRLPISVPPPRVPIQQPNNKNEIIYESVSSTHASSSRQSSSSHIYEIIGSERSVSVREKPKVPPRNSSTGLSKASKKGRPPLPVPNVPDVRLEQQKTLNPIPITMPNVLQPNVLKYFQQKLYQSFGTGGMNEGGMEEGNEMLFRCYNINNNGPSNIFGELNPISEVPPSDNITAAAKQQQIDMMLETAQFLATAAYLER